MTTTPAARPAALLPEEGTMLASITVDISGVGTKTYPDLSAQLAEHLATGGEIGALSPFIKSAKAAMVKSDWIRGVSGWVDFHDGTGLLYEVKVSPTGHHKILGAARL